MADRPIRASDIYLAKGFQWGGPDGPGPGSDPIRDVVGLIVGARTGHAVTDLDALPPRAPDDAPEPVLTMTRRVAEAFVAHPRVIAWLGAAPLIVHEPDGNGFAAPGHFRIRYRVSGFPLASLGDEEDGAADVIARDAKGFEVARLHGAWQ